MNNVYCMAPFIGIAKHTNKYSMCCMYDDEISSYDNIDMCDIYNSDLLKKMRIDMLNNNVPNICKKCLCVRNMYNSESYRDIYEYNLSRMSTDGHIDGYKIKNLHYVFNNICNLGCITCGGFSSTTYQKKYDVSNFINKFEKYSNNHCTGVCKNEYKIHEIIDNTNDVDIVLAGGEIMLSDSNMYIFDNLKNENNVYVYTNGTVVNDNILSKLNGMSKSVLYLSVDGDYEHNHIFRPKAMLVDVLNTFEYISNTYKNIEIRFCFTLSNVNISNMINTLDILLNYNKEIIINIVDNPDYLSIMSNSYNMNTNYHILCMALVKYIDNSSLVNQIRDILYKFNMREKKDMSIEYLEYMKIMEVDINE